MEVRLAKRLRVRKSEPPRVNGRGVNRAAPNFATQGGEKGNRGTLPGWRLLQAIHQCRHMCLPYPGTLRFRQRFGPQRNHYSPKINGLETCSHAIR